MKLFHSFGLHPKPSTDGPERKWFNKYPGFIGFSKVEELKAQPPSGSSDPTAQLEELLRKGGYKVHIKKGTKKITLFRFLLAKLLYDKVSGLHLDEYIVLMEIYYTLRSDKDPSFIKKYGDWFERTDPFFKDIAECQVFPARIYELPATMELYRDFLRPVVPSPEAYFGLKGNRDLRKSFALILNIAQPPTRKFQKRVIGVGYRDKGHLKLPHDGEPSWKQVASHFSEIFRQIADGEIEKDDIPSWLLSEFERESEE
jgi:hypothetical protein